MYHEQHSQWVFTCSNSTKEALEKGVKWVHSEQQKHQSDVNECPSSVFFY